MKRILPQQRTGFRLIDDGGRARLQTMAGERVCELNESALAIWELCDGSTTPEEMARAIAELCSIGLDRARDDVDRTLTALNSAGVIELRRLPSSPGRHDRSTTWSRSST